MTHTHASATHSCHCDTVASWVPSTGRPAVRPRCLRCCCSWRPGLGTNGTCYSSSCRHGNVVHLNVSSHLSRAQLSAVWTEGGGLCPPGAARGCFLPVSTRQSCQTATVILINIIKSKIKSSFSSSQTIFNHLFYINYYTVYTFVYYTFAIICYFGETWFVNKATCI